MRTICIASQKGGAGKTTLAINLAVEAETRRKSSVIIDLDPQASAAKWGDIREADFPEIIPVPAARLPAVLEAAREQGAKLAIIDTAPHSESSALGAARAADLVLIPCRPGILDLMAVQASVDLCALAKARAVGVVYAAPPRGSAGDEAQAALEGYGLEVAPVRICHRAAFGHSLTLGLSVSEFETKGKAAEEIRQLYLWTVRQVGK